MSNPLLEFEGTVEEIQERLEHFAGRRIRVTVQSTGDGVESDSAIDTALKQIWRDVPAEAWESLPTDLSANLDHYIHGTPKSK